MDVFIQELKRQLNLKRLSIYLLIVMSLAILWTWFIVGYASEDFMQTNCYNNLRGESVIKAAADDRNGTEGSMTEDKFQTGCNLFLNSLNGDDESDLTISKDLLKYSVYADTLIKQEFKLRQANNQSSQNLAQLPKDSGTRFYENEGFLYNSYIENNSSNEKEKSLSLSMWNNVEKPYTYYSGFKQWGEGIGHITIFSFVTMIIVCIFSSSIIAKDKENKLDEIISTTTKGRSSLIVSKVIISWLMTFLLCIFGIGLYLILLKIFLPNDALNTSIQVFTSSFFNYNVKDILRNSLIISFISIFTVTSFATLISTISKKSSRAIQISILAILIIFLFELFVNVDSKLLNIIDILLPGGLMFSYQQFIELNKFPFLTIGNTTFLLPMLSLIISIILLLLNTILTVISYKRR